MPGVRIQEAASWRLDEMYRYTLERWGKAQADRYITGLFEAFDRIESRGVASRPVPAEFGVQGYFSATNGMSSTGGACRAATSGS